MYRKCEDSFTCLAVDLPGWEKLRRHPTACGNWITLAEKIEQIRVENNIEKWHVVGHDAGSAIAVHYAHRFQDRVDRLALLSPAVFPELKPFHLFRIVRSPVIGELLAPAGERHLLESCDAAGLGTTTPELNDTVEDFHAPFSGPFGAWRLMSILRWGNPAEVLASMPAMLPQLKVPTLIFQGSRDKAMPEQFAQRACALIPQSKVVMVDSGHFIPLNNPEVVAAELLSFFGETSLMEDGRPARRARGCCMRRACPQLRIGKPTPTKPDLLCPIPSPSTVPANQVHPAHRNRRGGILAQ